MFDTFCVCLLSGELVACAGKKKIYCTSFGWRGGGKGREGMYSKRERMNEIL
jgi:hypothetical protein